MSGCDRILAELRTGPKTAAELYARTFTVLHSRISDLRRALYTLLKDRPAGPGAGVAGLSRATAGDEHACTPQRQPSVQAAQQLTIDSLVAA